jgi:hypothetical protein
MNINELVSQHERDISKYEKILAKSTTPEKADRAAHCENKIDWHSRAKELLMGVATVAGASTGVVALVGVAASVVEAVLDKPEPCNHAIGRGWVRQFPEAPFTERLIRVNDAQPESRNWTALYRFCPACGCENEKVEDVQGSDRFAIYLERQA